MTTLINTGLNTDDRLIRFLASQRSLYMPRHFIILITHELGHYVGKDIRNRNLRLRCIAKTLACLLAEGILPEFYRSPSASPHEFNIYDRLYCRLNEAVRNRIQEQCVSPIYNKVNEKNTERKDHATEMIPSLREICYELLEEHGIIHHIIFQYPEDLNVDFSEAELFDIMDPLYEFQNQMDRNRRILASSHIIIDSCINELTQVFREVFSDIAAWSILKYDSQTFLEVFNVSEGEKISESSGNFDVQRAVRIWIIEKVMSRKNNKAAESGFPEHAPQEKGNTVSAEYLMENWPYALKDELFSYSWAGKYLEEYAYACADAVEAQREKHQKEADSVKKDLFKTFCTNDKSCSDIYAKMVRIIISDYTSQVDSDYRHEQDLKKSQ